MATPRSQIKTCCKKLQQELGNHKINPTPAYVDAEDWKKAPWWYPGAKGPGFYRIEETGRTKDGYPEIKYRPLHKCPFCGKKPAPGGPPPDGGHGQP